MTNNGEARCLCKWVALHAPSPLPKAPLSLAPYLQALWEAR